MVLDTNERKDLLSEYEQHIEMKISSGLSEEEAIADFGDFEELIKELLAAYHLNTEYAKGNHFAETATYYIKSCANFLTSLMESLFNKSRKELFQLFWKCCCLFIFYLVVFGVVSLACSMVHSFFVYSLPFGNSLGRMISGIFQFAAYLFYLGVVIYLSVFFIKRYILENYVPLEQPVYTTSGHMAHPSETIETLKQKTGEISEIVVNKLDLSKSYHTIDGPSLWEICMKIFVFCVKFIAFFFLLGAAFSALGLVICTGLLLIFLFLGYSIIGPFLITVGCTAIAVVCTLVIFHFIFGGVRI